MGLEPTTFCMASRYRLPSCAASCSGKARFPGGTSVGRVMALHRETLQMHTDACNPLAAGGWM